MRNGSTDQGSISAYASALALTRAAKSQFKGLIDLDRVKITDHILATAHRAEASYLTWGLQGAISYLPYRLQAGFFNTVVDVGFDPSIFSRKLMIGQQIERAIAKGTKNILIIGGGYDAIGLVTALKNKNKGIQVFEIDKGVTQKNKLNALDSLPASLKLETLSKSQPADGVSVYNNNYHILSWDLGQDNLVTLLQENGFNRQEKTLVIVEGVTMYLSQNNNMQLLQSMHDLLKDEDNLLIGYATSLPRSIIQDTMLNSAKESYNFSLEPEKTISFINPYHFELTAISTAADRLEQVWDKSDANYYRNNPTAPQETYCLLTKSSSAQEKNQSKVIDKLPNLSLGLLHLADEETSSRCNVM